MRLLGCLLISIIVSLSCYAQSVNTIDVQCALKGAIFGHSWQKHQEGISKIDLIEQLTIKLAEDGAPNHYINIWIEQMDASLNIPDYHTMVGEIVYQCLINKGV